MGRSAASLVKADQVSIAPRQAEPPDAAPLAALMRAAYGVYVPRMDRPPAPMLQDYHAVISAGLAYVVDGTSSLDAAIVYQAMGDHLQVETIAVSPARQGEGVGRGLMDWAEAAAYAQDLPAIRLYTNAAMVENIAFYQRLGFRITHRAKDRGYQRIYFEKRLS